ncbi:phage tail protein [Lentzea sp.]|uniref:phage tail protein n=1 Tax=Lentzea sp. TaxID=56099 RepID=UPI002B76EA1F|nr:phage tail protein [Lentzea sp.]HUQ57203.1 phage tail protein [Lentzea sp.]
MTFPRVSTASSNTSTLVSAARFVITADRMSEISFSELSGITSEVEVSEYMSSNRLGVSLAKQFGRTKPATVVLKRGVDQDMALWTWHQEVLAGQPTARRSCSLLLLDMSGVIKQTYDLLNAWPSKLEIAGMKAGGSEAAIATVTLTCEQIDIKQ